MDVCRSVVRYSVRTSESDEQMYLTNGHHYFFKSPRVSDHPGFRNQLYAGVDAFSLAGTWLADSLNTSL